MTPPRPMTVTVRMHGNLRRFLPDGEEAASVERSTPLSAGDLVECYEPVAGG